MYNVSVHIWRSGRSAIEHYGSVTTGRFAGQFREELFAAAGCGGAEPVLMPLNPEFYELIWRGQKTHEFRRRFLRIGK